MYHPGIEAEESIRLYSQLRRQSLGFGQESEEACAVNERWATDLS